MNMYNLHFGFSDNSTACTVYECGRVKTVFNNYTAFFFFNIHVHTANVTLR